MSNENIVRPGPSFLRLSAGFVYFFFGFLKFFPDLSPGELLAGQTIMMLSMHRLDASTALWLLAIAECVIGLSFLFNICLRWTFFLFLFHQAGTFLPLFILPELTFKIAPFAPNLEGQYILKNVVSVAAGWTVMLPAVKDGWMSTFRRLKVRRSGVGGCTLARVAEPVSVSGHVADGVSQPDYPLVASAESCPQSCRPATSSTATAKHQSSVLAQQRQ